MEGIPSRSCATGPAAGGAPGPVAPPPTDVPGGDTAVLARTAGRLAGCLAAATLLAVAAVLLLRAGVHPGGDGDESVEVLAGVWALGAAVAFLHAGWRRGGPRAR